VRASDLEGKEVIELKSGERLERIKDWELLINTETGMVEALIVTTHGWGGVETGHRTIPWKQIRKISQELILFETDEAEVN